MALSLRLYAPIVIDSGDRVGIEIGSRISGWQRTIRDQGGYWRGSFSLEGDIAELAKWFYEYLGFHVVERSGGTVTFEGLVYEMDLIVGGATMRRTLDLMVNYTKTVYTDTSGVTAETAAAENTASQARYGRREDILTLDGQDAAAATAARDRRLKEMAWPWARPVGVTLGGGGARLDVQVCGYVFTANWRYESVGDDSDDAVSDWIGAILATDCEFVSAGAIDANALTVRKETPSPTRAWDVLKELASLGDADGDPWRLWVGAGRRAHYRQIETAPRYYLRGGRLYGSASGRQEVDPWAVTPGVVRVLDYPARKLEQDSWLQEARDFYIPEVSCGTGNGLVLKAEYWEESEILANQAEFAGRMSGGGYSGPPVYTGRHAYEHAGYMPKKWRELKAWAATGDPAGAAAYQQAQENVIAWQHQRRAKRGMNQPGSNRRKKFKVVELP